MQGLNCAGNVVQTPSDELFWEIFSCPLDNLIKRTTFHVFEYENNSALTVVDVDASDQMFAVHKFQQAALIDQSIALRDVIFSWTFHSVVLIVYESKSFINYAGRTFPKSINNLVVFVGILTLYFVSRWQNPLIVFYRTEFLCFRCVIIVLYSLYVGAILRYYLRLSFMVVQHWPCWHEKNLLSATKGWFWWTS